MDCDDSNDFQIQLDINQLSLNNFPQTWFNGATRNKVYLETESSFKLFGQGNETQPNRWVYFNKNINIAAFGLIPP